MLTRCQCERSNMPQPRKTTTFEDEFRAMTLECNAGQYEVKLHVHTSVILSTTLRPAPAYNHPVVLLTVYSILVSIHSRANTPVTVFNT